MSAKFNVHQEIENMRLSSRIEGDKVVISVECDVRTDVTRLPDRYQGPCVEVISLDPLLALVHGVLR